MVKRRVDTKKVLKSKKYLDDLLKPLAKWLGKNKQLEDKIKQLFSSQEPIDHIVGFILAGQLIEFEMIQLLIYIRLQLGTDGLINIKREQHKLPRWYSNQKATLGGLIRQDFKKYIKKKPYPHLEQIYDLIYNKELGLLDLRNNFTHKLFFLDYTITDLGNVAQAGIKKSFQVFDLMGQSRLFFNNNALSSLLKKNVK